MSQAKLSIDYLDQAIKLDIIYGKQKIHYDCLYDTKLINFTIERKAYKSKESDSNIQKY